VARNADMDSEHEVSRVGGPVTERASDRLGTQPEGRETGQALRPFVPQGPP